ncbi:MAG: hypothetical protein ACM3NQ_02615, partial [Bacteroidales bacterium]
MAKQMRLLRRAPAIRGVVLFVLAFLAFASRVAAAQQQEQPTPAPTTTATGTTETRVGQAGTPDVSGGWLEWLRERASGAAGESAARGFFPLIGFVTQGSG